MYPTDQRFEVTEPPGDTISDLSWYWQGPQTHPFIAASSWDGTVRIWQVQTRAPLRAVGGPPPSSMSLLTTPVVAAAQGVAKFTNPAPVLSTTFAGENLIAGTCDKKVMLYNLQSQQTSQIGQHENPVCKVFFHPGKQLVCALSWDKAINWWDTRSPTPVASLTAPSNIFTGDMVNDVLAVLCDDRKVYAYDLNTGQVAQSYPCAPLHYPARLVRVFQDAAGMVIGAYEGRSRIVHFSAALSNKDFNFRAHRANSSTFEPLIGPSSPVAQTDIFSLTAVDFSPIFGTLMTAGADGNVITWDKESRTKLQILRDFDSPITAARFDPSGQLLAVATGYDWSKGINGRNDLYRRTKPIVNKLFIVPVQDAWIRAKAKK